MGVDKDKSLWFASELKAIVDVCTEIQAIPPGHYWTQQTGFVRYYNPNWFDETRIPTTPVDLQKLAQLFEQAVVKRLMADVPVGTFLSGGLDSSLVAAMAKRHCKELHSFSDLQAARKVASFLGTIHHERIFTIQEGFEAVKSVIYHLETYDPSPIRSGCAMFGEGADEVFAGYLYFHEAVSPAQLHVETVKKVKALHGVQLQFNDRLSMAHSLEVRVPFLDIELLQYALNIDPSAKMHTNGTIEKKMLRKAFQGALPDEILWRQKEQFGDGVGYSWIDGVKSACERAVSDDEFAQASTLFPVDTPATKEQFYYRKIFSEYFPGNQAQATVNRWFPWSKSSNVDSSARAYAARIHESNNKTMF